MHVPMPTPPTAEEAEFGFRYEAMVGGVATRLEQVEVVRQQRIRNHFHDRPHAILVLEGTMRERRGSTEIMFEPGMVRVNGPAMHHLEFAGAGFRCVVLETDPRWVAGHAGSEDFHLVSSNPQARAPMARMQQHLQRGGAGRALLDLDAAELFALFTQQQRAWKGAAPAWLCRVHEQIRSMPVLPALDALAAEAGVHPGHVVRAFHEHFGITIGDAHRRLRVVRAASALLSGEQSLAAVAFMHGYCDQSHLNRALKKYLGTTPRRLRSRGRSAP